MITKLNISNFKPFVDTKIVFSNLTILTGINGYGKSSIIQSLLLLRQSFLRNILVSKGLNLNTPLVSLGVADTILSRYGKSPNISFCIEDSDMGSLEFLYKVGANQLSDTLILKAYYSDNVTEKNLSTMPLFNHSFQYVGAMREGGRSEFPSDTYMVEDERQMSTKEGRCDLLGPFLYKYKDDVCPDFASGMGESTIMEQVNLWEQALCPNVKVQVLPSDTDKNAYKITYDILQGDKVVVKGVSAGNVGLGLSYTLPVIVSLVAARPGDFVIIDTPEAHLHPAGQAQLAKLIVEVVNYGVQVLVETHSDHIINGVLIACKQYELLGKGMSKDNVAISYMGSRNEDGSTCVEPINIDLGGKLQFQPDGFMDQSEKDVMLINS